MHLAGSLVLPLCRFYCDLTGVFVNGNDKFLLGLIQTTTDTSPVHFRSIEICTKPGDLQDCGQHLIRDCRRVG